MKGKRIAALLLAAVLVFSQEGISSLTVQAAQMPEEQSTAPQTEGTGTEDDKADQENRGEKEQTNPSEETVSSEKETEESSDDSKDNVPSDDANQSQDLVPHPEENNPSDEPEDMVQPGQPEQPEQTEEQQPEENNPSSESEENNPPSEPEDEAPAEQQPGEKGEEDSKNPEEPSEDQPDASEEEAIPGIADEGVKGDKEPSLDQEEKNLRPGKELLEDEEEDVIPSKGRIAPQQEQPADEFQEAKEAFARLTADHEVYALVYGCTEAELLDVPVWEGRPVAAVRGGYQVQLIGTELVDGVIWYQVQALVNGNTYTGYIGDDMLISADAGLAEWREAYWPQALAYSVPNMRAGSTNLSLFPESYRPYIQALLNAHPEWTFVPMDTGLDWNTVIKNEMSPKRNVVPNYSDPSWIGDYNIIVDDVWYQASESIVRYYMDPRNFLNETSVFQFELLSFNAANHKEAGVKAILNNTFMSNKVIEGTNLTYAQAFMQIGKEVNVSPYHLASRVRQEQGVSGDSPLISGTYPGYEGLYNYFNIQATGANRDQLIANGLTEARNEGWTSRYAALRGGSAKVAVRIGKGQNTLYLQKFDVDDSDGTLYWNQYMQNLLAPDNEGKTVRKGYEEIGVINNPFVFRVPIYRNMPSSACKMPSSLDGRSATLKTSVKNYTTVNLSWNELSGAQGYQIYRSESQNGSYKKVKTISSVGTLSWSQTVDPNKIYYYKVRGYKELGGQTRYSEFSAVKSANTTIPKPQWVSLKASTYTQAALKWEKPGSVTGYQIYRKDGKNGSYKKVKTITGAGTVSYTDKTILPNTTYYYKIRSYVTVNGANKYSSFSPEKSISTTMAKVQWTSLKAGSYTQAAVKWKKAANVTGYQIYRKDGKNGSYKKVKTITNASTVSYNDKTILPNTTYYYKIRSYVTANGTTKYSSFNAEKSISTTMAKVQWTSLKAGSYTQAAVKWKKAANVTGYQIYRKDGKNGSYKKIKTITKAGTVSYTDKTVLPNTTYYYKIRSYVTVNGANKYSSFNGEKSINTKMAVPSIVSATLSGNKNISLKWEAQKWVSGYRIYRADTSGGKYKMIKDISNGKTTSYTDKNLEANGTYYYKIRSYVTVDKSKKYSSYSNVFMGKTKLTTPSVTSVSAPSPVSAKLSWKKTVSATGYEIYRATSYNGKYTKVKTITKNTTVKYANTNLTPNKTYFYKVRAYSKVGTNKKYSKFSAVTSITPGLDTPEIHTIDSVTTTKARLKWNQVSGAQGYRLYRSEKPGSGYKLVKTLSGEKKTAYTNSGLKKGKTYYYKVRAYVKLDGAYKYSDYSDVWSVQTKK
ncbi:MAG: hypothetical protein HFI76_04055 [Lachnospiraceae bacterium]|nr:hypothetical protein [Lachnospiraceae bacterium]